MQIALLASFLLSTALAIPPPVPGPPGLKQLLQANVPRQNSSDWQPSEGTVATCDATSDKYISLVIGPEQGSVIYDHACAGILPTCAYPESLPEGTVCTQTMNYKLAGPKNITLNALVEQKDNHNKLSDWAVNFAVTPAKQPETSAGVFITKADCIGYFKELLEKTDPKGCNIAGLGPSAGTLTVGGTTSLKDAVFGVSFVKRS